MVFFDPKKPNRPLRGLRELTRVGGHLNCFDLSGEISRAIRLKE